MNCLKKSVVFLLFMVMVQYSSCNNMRKQSYELPGIHNYINCSDDRECPTWFVCNSTNVCQCGNEHDKAIVCDNKTFRSAVLVCNCVTYDKRVDPLILDHASTTVITTEYLVEYMRHYQQILKL